MDNKETPKKDTKKWCSGCKKETNQQNHYEDTIFEPIEIFHRGSSESAWLVGCKEVSISTCNGCDTKNLGINESHIGPKGLAAKINKKSKKITPPNWIFELENENIFSLFIEVYNAINSNLSRLAIMGVRSLVDFHLNNKVGDIGGFAKKLKTAEKIKILSKQQYEILSSVVEVGHSITHRGASLDVEDVLKIMNVVEPIFIEELSLGRIKKIESRLSKK